MGERIRNLETEARRLEREMKRYPEGSETHSELKRELFWVCEKIRHLRNYRAKIDALSNKERYHYDRLTELLAEARNQLEDAGAQMEEAAEQLTKAKMNMDTLKEAEDFYVSRIKELCGVEAPIANDE